MKYIIIYSNHVYHERTKRSREEEEEEEGVEVFNKEEKVHRSVEKKKKKG